MFCHRSLQLNEDLFGIAPQKDCFINPPPSLESLYNNSLINDFVPGVGFHAVIGDKKVENSIEKSPMFPIANKLVQYGQSELEKSPYEKSVTVEVLVNESTMPYVIGQGGKRINSVKVETNCDIKNYNGSPKFTIVGLPINVKRAVQKIKTSERIGLTKSSQTQAPNLLSQSWLTSLRKHIREKQSENSEMQQSRFLNKFFPAEAENRKENPSNKSAIEAANYGDSKLMKVLLLPLGSFREDYELLDHLIRFGNIYGVSLRKETTDSVFWNRVSQYLCLIKKLEAFEVNNNNVNAAKFSYNKDCLTF